MQTKRPILLVLALGLSLASAAEPVRLANGVAVPGEVVKATAAELEIQSPRGLQKLPWEQLSAGTRYRYQPGFRDAFPQVLAGEAVEIAAAAAPPLPPAPAPTPNPPQASPTPSGGSSFTPVASAP